MISKHRNLSYLMYFAFCMLTIFSFTYGYLHTTGKINENDPNLGIGAYEGIRNESQNISSEDVSAKSVLLEDTLLTMRTYYSECGHTVNETIKIPQDLKNLTEMEFKLAYKDWTIEKFTVDEIIITKKVEEKCPNHYVVKVKDDKLAVYYQRPINGITLKETTNISVSNLPRKDKERIEQGILVESDEALAGLLEDFES